MALVRIMMANFTSFLEATIGKAFGRKAVFAESRMKLAEVKISRGR